MRTAMNVVVGEDVTVTDVPDVRIPLLGAILVSDTIVVSDVIVITRDAEAQAAQGDIFLPHDILGKYGPGDVETPSAQEISRNIAMPYL
jgi:hypothetical protein